VDPASRLQLRTDSDGVDGPQARLGAHPPPGNGDGGRVVHTTRDEPAEGFDRIGFRRTASARRPDHEAPLRCGFGSTATRCPPTAAVFGSCATGGTRDRLDERGPHRNVPRYATVPAPSLRRGRVRTEASFLRQPERGNPGGRRAKRQRWETGSPAGARSDLEKERSPGRSGSSTHRQRRGAIPDPTMEQGLGAGAPDPPTPTDLDLRQRNQARRGGDRAENGRGATDAATRSGYRRGVLRGVRTCIAGKRAEFAVFGPGARRAETRWTPGSAAGCNKPATRGAEETVEVVRNHEGGTGLRGWNPRSRSDGWPSSQEWTLHGHVDGGATGAASGSRGSDMRTEPKREGREIDQGDRYGSGEERR